MSKLQKTLVLALAILVLGGTLPTHASQAKVHGEYCYQYGDSESLMVAKEISYAMALRKAIETYQTFVTSTSIVQDFQLRSDLVQLIASGYVENIEIIKQYTNDRRVCTELIGYVNPDSIKDIIRSRIENISDKRQEIFGGIFSTEDFKILYYRRYSRLSKPLWKNRNIDDNLQNEAADVELLLYPYILDRSGLDVFVYYQAKKDSIHSNLVIVDCYDSEDRQIQGTRFKLGTNESSLYRGEVRRTKFVLPPGTKSFQFRLPGQ